MGVTQMGNTMPRAGLETTSLAFWASVRPLHQVGTLMSPLYPCPHVYSADYYTWSPGILRLVMLTITYIQAMVLNIKGRSNNHTAHSSDRIKVTATSVLGVMKMVYTVPRAGLKPTSLASQVSVLPLHRVGSLVSPLFPCPPVCVAPCLRGQCRLLE